MRAVRAGKQAVLALLPDGCAHFGCLLSLCYPAFLPGVTLELLHVHTSTAPHIWVPFHHDHSTIAAAPL
jgi:hypothetical protein